VADFAATEFASVVGEHGVDVDPIRLNGRQHIVVEQLDADDRRSQGWLGGERGGDVAMSQKRSPPLRSPPSHALYTRVPDNSQAGTTARRVCRSQEDLLVNVAEKAHNLSPRH